MSVVLRGGITVKGKFEANDKRFLRIEGFKPTPWRRVVSFHVEQPPPPESSQEAV